MIRQGIVILHDRIPQFFDEPEPLREWQRAQFSYRNHVARLNLKRIGCKGKGTLKLFLYALRAGQFAGRFSSGQPNLPLNRVCFIHRSVQ